MTTGLSSDIESHIKNIFINTDIRQTFIRVRPEDIENELKFRLVDLIKWKDVNNFFLFLRYSSFTLARVIPLLQPRD